VADAAALAERWFALARSENLQELVAALAVGKARMLAARDVMQRERAHYDAFLDVLLAGISNTNPRIRFECAHALDSFGDTRCREPLTRLMDDPVPRVRWIAIHALSCHACNEASCVDDPSVHARIAQRALSDASIQVRRHAAGALGMIAAPATVDALRAIIARDTDPGLLRAARWALSRCNAAKEAAGDVGSPNASPT
jgi:HEAT repeat protein